MNLKYSELKVKAAKLLWSIDRETTDQKNRGKYSAEDIAEMISMNKSTVWMICKGHRRTLER